MSEYILNVANETAKMDWAYSFQRTGAFPLDRSSLFSSYDDAVLYAQGANDERGLGGTSYVGQPISVYDQNNNTVTLYVIDIDRSLKEVGSASIESDNCSIEVVDGVVQVKNFGKGYYKYVASIKDPLTGEITTPSSYEYVDNDFIAGLEPRVILNDLGSLEIAWYEPSEETIDGVSTKVESVSQTVDTLEDILNGTEEQPGLVDQVADLNEAVGEASDGINAATGLYKEVEDLKNSKADKDSVYTKTETDEAIASAIINLDHLSRRVVNSKDEIDVNSEFAHLYIYMVPTGLQEDDDKYDEYIVIDGSLEKVGSWEISLDNYATVEELNTVKETIETNKTNIENALAQEQLRAETVENEHALAIQGLQDAVNNVTDIATGAQDDIATLEQTIDGRLLSDDDKAKLEKLVLSDDGTVGVSGTINASNVKELDTWLETNAPIVIKDLTENNFSSEVVDKINFITAVDTTQLKVENSTLSIINIDGSIITNLNNNTEFNNIKVIGESNASKITSLEELTSVHTTKINENIIKIGEIENNLNNYVLKSTYDVDLKEIRDILTWQEMPNS